MRVSFDPNYAVRHGAEGRQHPWIAGELDNAIRYYDFKQHPGLIETALEDFVPFSDYPATRKFYELLKFINGPDSAFESNDCAFRLENNAHDDNGKAKRAYGRLIVLVRELVYNTSHEAVDYYLYKIAEDLHSRDAEFKLGACLLTKFPTQFIDYPAAPEKQEGSCGEILFWAWGDTDREAMENLDRLFDNLTAAIHNVSEHINSSLAKQAENNNK